MGLKIKRVNSIQFKPTVHTSKGPLGLVDLNGEVHVLLVNFLINDSNLDVLSADGEIKMERKGGSFE